MDCRPALENVLIIGYPKSGCTWLTRLVAELLDCSVAGFWNSTKKELAIEGIHRVSKFRCFKSHHQLHEIADGPVNGTERLIYIIRDPRDVAISGAHYFEITRCAAAIDAVCKTFGNRKTTKRFLHNIFSSEKYRLRQMCKAVLHGSEDVHHWCRVSWKMHLTAYRQSGTLFVRYEDLQRAPIIECARMLDYLNVVKDFAVIERAVDNQSFGKKKSKFQENGELRQMRFLRSGKVGEWREKLTASQKKLFLRELAEELKAFSYPL